MSSPSSQQGGRYLSGLAAYSPWSSRSATPKPEKGCDSRLGDEGQRKLETQRGGDHLVSHRHRLSLRQYPRDCPPLSVKWFHAVDIPKRKPLRGRDDLPPAPPKKFVAFSDRDSRAIETAFQVQADAENRSDRDNVGGQSFGAGGDELDDVFAEAVGDPADDNNEKKFRRTGDEESGGVKVSVNEDFLFDVDIGRRELAPVYWLGPVYDCKRGTWFTVEGNAMKPCDENLATQLEEGYLKLRPWHFPKAAHQRSSSQSSKIRSRPVSMKFDESDLPTGSSSLASKASTGSLEGAKISESNCDLPAQPQEATQRTFRLFGAYMNSIVTYQDQETAWIMSDDFLSGMRGTVYERFAGGAHYAGIKVLRGFRELGSKKEVKGETPVVEVVPDVAAEGQLKASEEESSSPSLRRRVTLERQMSSLVESGTFTSRELQEEEMRRRDEKEIQNDYTVAEDEQGREIEHLILVTHGIGQQLGLRFESVNFVHDVNTLRKTLKSVYNASPDLQALNSEVEAPTKNCRVQVLPICWRHLLNFPQQALQQHRKRDDLGLRDANDEELYPSVDDITVNSVFRSLITDLALDILLYESPVYKRHITRIVLEECNRIYSLFKQRNPKFRGKVSLMGHSLGSAIMFDILCDHGQEESSTRKRLSRRNPKEHDEMRLEFKVEDFYALGSPVGLFQMLKGRTISAKRSSTFKLSQTTYESGIDDPFSTASDAGNENTVSSPSCQRIFNIFHQTDPISYRIEPLISPAMSKLKPQPLPYTKRGIFGAPGQGITGLGARVGQSVSGMWSSLSSGLASSLLNRSLGISADDAVKVPQSRAPLAMGAGTNITSGGVIPPANLTPSDAERLLKGELSIHSGEDGVHPPTLLDSEIETLYDGFQKRRKASGPLEMDDERREMERQARRLREEESKVRSLNGNGRVDYCIQEGTFDISLLAGIASHLSYWAEEDVSHFVISQLLSRHRILQSKSWAGK